MELATGNHSHKVPGSRNGVEGRHFKKLWYEGVYLYGMIIIMWNVTLIHPGRYLRVDASLKRQKLYICATNEETNLHKHIRNV